MAWLEQTYMNGQHKYWTDTDTGEITYTQPSSGQIVNQAPQPTWTESKYMDGQHSAFTNDKTGEVVYSREATLTPEQREQEFMTLWNNPNASSFEKAQAVQKQYGIETLAQLVNQGRFQDVPDIGAYVAARQREANDAGFTVGGNKLGLWPVAIGMAAGGLLGGTANAGTSGAAAEGAAAGGTASSAGNVLAGAGDMFGSGAVYESGVANLGAGASATGGVLSGSGDMFGSGATWDAGTAGLQPGAVAAPTGGAAALDGSTAATGTGVATGGGAATSSGLLGSGASGLLSNPSVIGAGVGAGLSLLGSNSKQAGTIQTEEGIPDWLMPYVQPALQKYSTELQNYQTDPYGIMPSAMTEFKNTINGMYLDPSTNKYLEDYFKLGAERIKGSLSPTFGHMQAFGQHSGYNEALSRGLGDYAVGLYGGNYSQERDRQQQMTAAAPAFLGQSSQAAFQPYSQYLQSIGSLGRKKEEPYFNNQFGNILGGAMFGSQFGNAFK